MNIILFTETYPLSGLTEEPFIRPEIKLLSDKFEKVYIVPFDVTQESDGNVELPGNVFVTRSYGELCSCKIGLKGALRHPLDGLRSAITNINFRFFKEDWKKRIEYRVFEKWLTCFLVEQDLREGDVVLYSFWLARQAEFIGMWCRRHPKTNAVSRAHRYDIFDVWRTHFRYIALAGLSKVYPCSEDGMRALKEQYPRYKGKFEVSYLGVEQPAKQNPNPPDTGLITFFSCHNLIRRKRGSFCAKVLVALADSLPEVKIKWVVIGDGEEMEPITKICNAAPRNFIADIRGRLPNSTVRKILSTEPVDFTILLSSSEGLAVTEQESLAFGIPVISTDVGGASECVCDGAGVLVDLKDDVIAVVRKISSVIQHRSLMRKKAYENYKKRFDSLENRCRFMELILS